MFLFAGCAGIERINAKHKTDSQLKLRLSQDERELGRSFYGPDAILETNMLHSERDAIERELLSRCEAGDHIEAIDSKRLSAAI